jgi:pimeloyl-ACP methyl ester carboxylesterase
MTENTSPFELVEAGSGVPVLILHGGGGPLTVAPIAKHLSPTMHTIVPTHPGWNGTPRPDTLTTIAGIAALYLDFLAARGLTGVTVIGSSLGGWIAAEMALQDDSARVARLVLIDSGGIEVEGAPMRDFFALDARGVAEYAFHDSAKFFTDPATVPAEQVARQRANMATMRVFAGDPYMHDPTLLDRLPQIAVPTLVLWGESDRIFTPDYGRALAAAIPDASFELLSAAGHLPQIEAPAVTFGAIDRFLARALR